MAFTTMAQVLAALPGQAFTYDKSWVHTAGTLASLFTIPGYPPTGANPSSGLAGDVPTNATLGALPIVNPASGALNLARFTMSQNVVGGATTLMLYDRLWHNSGISPTAVTAQTINSVALTRPDALGADAEAWWCVYSSMGAGTPQITLTYTDQDGNTGNSALSGVLATTMGSLRSGVFSLAAGDTGVQSIQTYQADASFTSGTLGLVIRRRVATITVYDPIQAVNDIIRCGLEKVPNGACLELVAFSAASGTNVVSGDINIVNG